MEKMKVPKKEITDSVTIKKTETSFNITNEVVEIYNKIPDVTKMRDRFANIMFIKETVSYLVFLIVLTAVALLSSTNGNTNTYGLANAVSNQFITSVFTDVGDKESFWNVRTVHTNVISNSHFSGLTQILYQDFTLVMVSRLVL
jgi:hypothetical protein